jgi:hypothetical protein
LVIDSGASIPTFFVASRGSRITTDPGSVGGGNLDAIGATVVLHGGGFSYLNAFDGTDVTLAGGQAGYLEAFAHSKVAIGANSTANNIIIHADATANISGGTVSTVNALTGSSVTISGGSIPTIQASAGSVFNLIGTRFTLNGLDISATLPLYTPFQLADRNKQLLAYLTDGKTLVSRLSTSSTSTGIFNASAMLNLILVLPGDFNLDQKVDAADYVLWRSGGSPNPNSSGDFGLWRANFGRMAGSGAALSSIEAPAAVPEPTTFGLFVWLLASLCFRRRRDN